MSELSYTVGAEGEIVRSLWYNGHLHESHRSGERMTEQISDQAARRLEIIAAIILSLASLLTAWSSYQAAQWSRTQSIKSNASVTRMVESSQFSTLASQDTLVDVITFTNWLEAISVENQALADFYHSRFRAELQPAFEAWLALKPLQNPDAPATPFAMTEYNPANRQAAVAKQEEVTALQAESRAAAEYAELYVRNTLFLASALFFIGMSRMFAAHTVRLTLEILAAILLLIGFYTALTAPIV